MYGVCHSIVYCVDVNIATSLSMDMQASDTSDWSILDELVCFENIMPIDNVRGSHTVSQPIIVQCVFVYFIIVGDIIICKIECCPCLDESNTMTYT